MMGTLLKIIGILVICGVLFWGINYFYPSEKRIQKASTNSVLQKINEIATGITVFRSKYDGLPGDTRNAKALGLDDTNGNGDKKIDEQESRRVWLQLSAAYMTGFKPDKEASLMADYKAIPGKTVPKVLVIPERNLGALVGYYESNGMSGNAIIVGAPSLDGSLNGGGLTPKEASLINKNPAIGDLTINGEGTSSCVVDGKYNLSSDERSCVLVFWLNEPKRVKGGVVYKIR